MAVAVTRAAATGTKAGASVGQVGKEAARAAVEMEAALAVVAWA
jgi:hypothetical protein